MNITRFTAKLLFLSLVVATFASAEEEEKRELSQSPWLEHGFNTRAEWKAYKKAVRKGWPLPPKPAPVPPKPQWPTPTPKPPTKPVWPAGSWPGPCDKTYELVFADRSGTLIDAAASDKGDYRVFSGDIWQKNTHFKKGFLQEVKFVMEPINHEKVDFVWGSVQIMGYGQISFSGFERNKYENPPDKDGAKGPIQTIPIIGGTGDFLGAGGEVECSLFRMKKGSPDFYFLFKFDPYCPVYPPKKNAQWP